MDRLRAFVTGKRLGDLWTTPFSGKHLFPAQVLTGLELKPIEVFQVAR